MKIDQSFSLPVVGSLAIHMLAILFMVGNWSSTPKEVTVYQPHIVNATLVDLTPKAIAAPQQPKPQVLDNRRRQEEERRQQQERERQQAQKREQERKVQEAKTKAEQERIAKVKADQARQKAAEEERKRKAEAERKQREEQQREAQARLDAALQKEEQFLSDRSDSVSVKSYESLIQERIIDNWNRPPSARNGMQALLEIQMVPTGQVISVRILRGSGDIAFDRAAEQAVRRIDRFSEIQGMPNDVFERHFRVFRLNFQPEDLRQ